MRADSLRRRRGITSQQGRPCGSPPRIGPERRRRAYELTAKGRRALSSERTDWRVFASVAEFGDPLTPTARAHQLGDTRWPDTTPARLARSTVTGTPLRGPRGDRPRASRRASLGRCQRTVSESARIADCPLWTVCP